jgi:hypothetical protein
MSKFTTSNQGINKTTNLAGGTAYKIADEKAKLITQVFTSFFNEKKYYGDNSVTLVETIRNVVIKDPKFISNLARFSRSEMHLRTIPQVLVAELAYACKGEEFVKNAIADVCLRADDTYEILGYYIATFGKPIPNSLKKGIALALDKQNAYGLAKYNRSNRPNLADAIKLCHPTAKPEYKQVIEGTIATPKTWETVISAIPKTETEKVKAAWEDLIETKSLGMMGLMRNLRNIINANVDNLDKALSQLTNEKAVLNSKQLPFRFYSAYQEIAMLSNPNVSKVLSALEKAFLISIDNLPKFGGKTAVIVDNSGSMRSQLSDKSKMQYIDVAGLFGAMSGKICDDCVVVAFGAHAKTVGLNDYSSVFDNFEKIKNCNVGMSTDLYLAFDLLTKNNINVDRIIVFSDMQAYNSSGWYSSRTAEKSFLNYKKTVNSDVVLHSVDLAGYGSSPFNTSGINLVAGFSDRIFEFMKYYEMGENKIIDMISNYK